MMLIASIQIPKLAIAIAQRDNPALRMKQCSV